MVNVSTAAASKINELLTEEGKVGSGLRVFVQGGGCSGFQYGLMALDATCSHESCTVTGADGNVYVCPCHGSRYSRTGQVLEGPAKAALRQFATTFADGVVTIAV